MNIRKKEILARKTKKILGKKLRKKMLVFFVFIDAVHFSVRDDKAIKKVVAYFGLRVCNDGKRSIWTLY